MKKIDKAINKIFYDNISRPLRNKKDFVILLLETVKLFYVEEIFAEAQGRISIVVDKMSRVFYQVENKLFSIVFPFGIECRDSQYRIYDIHLDIDIDSKLISIMKSMISRLEISELTAEDVFELYCEEVTDQTGEEEAVAAWKILSQLFTIELGYIRYDLDEEHADKVYHPLNHLDINYTSNAAYKIGLKRMIKMEDMISLLNINFKCAYLE